MCNDQKENHFTERASCETEKECSKMLSTLPCFFVFSQYLHHESSNSKLTFLILNTKHPLVCPLKEYYMVFKSLNEDIRQTLSLGIEMIILFMQMTLYVMD